VLGGRAGCWKGAQRRARPRLRAGSPASVPSSICARHPVLSRSAHTLHTCAPAVGFPMCCPPASPQHPPRASTASERERVAQNLSMFPRLSQVPSQRVAPDPLPTRSVSVISLMSRMRGQHPPRPLEVCAVGRGPAPCVLDLVPARLSSACASPRLAMASGAASVHNRLLFQARDGQQCMDTLEAASSLLGISPPLFACLAVNTGRLQGYPVISVHVST
jgi:hypothetical protein